MALRFPPRAGTLAICRFPAPGMAAAAEMVKNRPVIVVSRILRGRHGLATVVPVSMTRPNVPRRWHVLVPADAMPHGWSDKPGERWAKCDMVTTVSLERLSLANARRHAGRPVYGGAEVDELILRQIREALGYIFELF
ncbi:type II toxin-antitoxin system PemK/MazF family toxin [Xanthomonas sp. NCPPB 2632]|uniref:type II toxin-antitoxin system PemK/MazF family toxin n=1 Tax=Xanthomonas sp. NCPPB 2632 TaxID=3240912 RepID=UPI0035134E1E